MERSRFPRNPSGVWLQPAADFPVGVYAGPKPSGSLKGRPHKIPKHFHFSVAHRLVGHTAHSHSGGFVDPSHIQHQVAGG
jgi:hypothetical protein